MKKLNKNAFVFIIVFVMIYIGVYKVDYVDLLKSSLIEFCKNIKINNIFSDFSDFTHEVDTTSIEQINFHNDLVNINSMFNRFINTRIIRKEDETVVKMDNGMLAREVDIVTYEKIKSYADKVSELKKSTNLPVLYVMAPKKGFNGGFPLNADNYVDKNCNKFLEELKSRNINYLDLRNSMESQGKTVEECFFATDHHWKPKTGLWATNEICKQLNNDFGFKYDSDLININNYNVDTYNNAFLGSEGKKTGIYFTKYGLEDFDLIYPKFSTYLTVKNEFENTTVSGEFKNTVLYLKHLNFEDPYQSWAYSTYSDGDNAVQVIDNHNMSSGKTILVVRDSFACVVTPFLSMECKSLHVLDLRTNITGIGRINSVSDYAKSINADYIVLLYNSVQTSECYDFN